MINLVLLFAILAATFVVWQARWPQAPLVWRGRSPTYPGYFGAENIKRGPRDRPV